MGDTCEGVDKAMITREEWRALNPRQKQSIDGIADNVIVQHTGPDTCNALGLSSTNCEKCLEDESCVKQAIQAMQDEDMSKLNFIRRCSFSYTKS